MIPRCCLLSYDNGSLLPFTPLNLAYLSSALKRAGWQVDTIRQDVYHFPDEALTDMIDDGRYDLVGLGFVAGYYQFRKAMSIALAVNRCKTRDRFKFVLGGHGPAGAPEYFLDVCGADHVVVGFGEEAILNLDAPVVYGNKCPDTNPDFTCQEMGIYRLHRFPGSDPTDFTMPILSGRGCPYKCLAGDTPVNTIEGMIPIKELVGRRIKVLTYDKNADRVLFADAINIMRTQENAQLVRVSFDDGTFIECTPDHRFKRFYNGNQNAPTREETVEALDLKPGNSVRAVRREIVGLKGNYECITWRRRKRISTHRLAMEAMIGRRLGRKEHVHHVDGDSLNNNPSNLMLCGSAKEHSAKHPEISTRMRENNPTKNMTDEWRSNISASGIGKRRTEEQRKRYSESKRGEKNPNYKNGDHINYATRLRSTERDDSGEYRAITIGKHPNHKVVSVEPIAGLHDTYCMEVPGYHWFYANDVLVHNCSFCYRMTKGFQPRPVEDVMVDITILHQVLGVTHFQFADELLMSSKARSVAFAEAISALPFKIKWDCNGRLNHATPEVLKLMKRSGCNYINFGVEAMSDKVLAGMNKKLTVDTIIAGTEATIEAGITPGLNLMWGNIGDDEDTLQEAVKFLLKYDGIAELRTIRPVTPYPGCELFSKAVELGLLNDAEDFYVNKHTNSDLFSVSFMEDFTPEEANQELARANDRLVSAYYMRCATAASARAKAFYSGQEKNFRGWRAI